MEGMQNPHHQYQDIGADASTLGSKSSVGSAHDVNNEFEDEEGTISNSNESQLAGGYGGGGSFPPNNRNNNNARAIPRIVTAGDELESLCRAEMSGGSNSSMLGFPPTCLHIVSLLAGNHCCVDCGDEDPDRLGWASIGYGTLLCMECAHRHATMSEEKESAIKSLKEDHWNLRSTLALLEGSNTRMLDYVKHKPRWRPPKGSKETFTDDALAFKKIYLSKAAASYRKSLGRRVDGIFYGRITAMREQDAAREETMATVRAYANSAPNDPFRQIFEQNEVSGEDIPGLFDASGDRQRDADEVASCISSKGGDRGGATDADVAAAVKASRGLGKKGRGGVSLGLTRDNTPSMDTIKRRIELRRSMNVSIAASLEGYHRTSGKDSLVGIDANANSASRPAAPLPSENATRPNNNTPLSGACLPLSSRRNVLPIANRRRSLEYGVVGEVGDAAIEEVEDQASISGASAFQRRPSVQQQQGMWMVPGNIRKVADEPSALSYQSRAISAASAAPLGTYRRLGTGVPGNIRKVADDPSALSN